MDHAQEAATRPGTASATMQAADCPACGGAPGGRIGFASLAGLVRRHAKLERGLPHTLFDLVVRPGRMLSDYLAAHRRREYVNPVSYLLLSAAASLLAFELYRDGYERWIGARLAASAQAWGESRGRLPAEVMRFQQAYSESVMQVLTSSTFASLALVLPFGLAVWLATGTRRVNLAESLVFALYAVGTALFAHTLLIVPVLLADGFELAQHLGLVLYLALPLWIGLDLFGRTWATVLRMGLAMLGGYVVGVAVILVAVFALTALRLGGGA